MFFLIAMFISTLCALFKRVKVFTAVFNIFAAGYLLEAVLLQSKWVNYIANMLEVVSHHLHLRAMRKFVCRS
jgi:hypothetical protein